MQGPSAKAWCCARGQGNGGAVILAGLFPTMSGSGTGSEVMQRIAAPMVGGIMSHRPGRYGNNALFSINPVNSASCCFWISSNSSHCLSRN